MADIRENNINLLRLVAATQVMLGHVLTLTPGAHLVTFNHLLGYLPGVPIFFFLSGFLITGSWTRHSDLREYALHRVLRIYPALWVALVVSSMALLILYSVPVSQHCGIFAMWILAQCSLLQSWNPEFLRGYGTGVVNGSLWTIPLELLFYAATPGLLLLGERLSRPALVVAAAMLISAIFYALFICIPSHSPSTPLFVKVMTLSPLAAITWFWMFGFGMIANLFRAQLVPLAVKSIGPLFLFFLLAAICAHLTPLPGILQAHGNDLGVVNFLALAGLVLGFAFGFPGLSRCLIGGMDASYGLYIYHMLVLNVMLTTGHTGDGTAALTILVAFGLAGLSWSFVEHPALQAKKRVNQLVHRAAPP